MRSSQYLLKTLNIFNYKNPKGLDDLKNELATLYQVRKDQIFLTLNGRSAIYLFLKSLNLPEGTKVAVPGFTCNAAVNPIIWAGFTPVYFDINEEDLSSDSSLLSDDSVKVIMIQHTFGLTSKNTDAILEYAKKRGIIVFEDCAHVLGMKEHNRENLLGTRSSANVLSFGLEKMLSTKIGGALIINEPERVEAINAEFNKMKEVPRYTNFLWLLHPIFWRSIRNLPFSIRPLIDVLENIGLLKLALPKKELKGVPARNNMGKMSGVIGEVIADEIENELKDLLDHRIKINSVYKEKFAPLYSHITDDYSSALIRFPLILDKKEDRDTVCELLKSMNVYFTTLYNPNIYPKGVDLVKFKYEAGSCPKAESVAERIVNLPTGKNISIEYARIIADEIISKINKR